MQSSWTSIQILEFGPWLPPQVVIQDWRVSVGRIYPLWMSSNSIKQKASTCNVLCIKYCCVELLRTFDLQLRLPIDVYTMCLGFIAPRLQGTLHAELMNSKFKFGKMPNWINDHLLVRACVADEPMWLISWLATDQDARLTESVELSNKPTSPQLDGWIFGRISDILVCFKTRRLRLFVAGPGGWLWETEICTPVWCLWHLYS